MKTKDFNKKVSSKYALNTILDIVLKGMNENDDLDEVMSCYNHLVRKCAKEDPSINLELIEEWVD